MTTVLSWWGKTQGPWHQFRLDPEWLPSSTAYWSMCSLPVTGVAGSTPSLTKSLYYRVFKLAYLIGPLHRNFASFHVSSVKCQVSDFRCHLSTVICHLSAVSCQLSAVSCQLSAVSCHLSPVTCHLSPVTCHLSAVSCQLSAVTCHLSTVTCQLSAVTCHLTTSLCSFRCYESPRVLGDVAEEGLVINKVGKNFFFFPFLLGKFRKRLFD